MSESSGLTDEQARRAVADVLGFTPSDPQFDALCAVQRPAVVVAGAGSGKTAVMSARMLWMVLTGQADPGHLLGLTFTNKAAHELLTRTRGYLAEARSKGHLPAGEQSEDSDADPRPAGDPVISTYHSFAASIIADHGMRIGMEPHARVLTDGAREQLAARIVSRTDRDMSMFEIAPKTVVQRMLSLDNALSELDVTTEQLRDDAAALIDALDHAEKLLKIGKDMRATARLRIALAGLVDDFRAAKRARGVLDFADQMRLATAIIRDFPDVVDQLRDAHRIVLLDEYQDTSVAQRILLQEIFGAGHPVTAVGDPCQAIYEWRGASVVNIDRFVDHFPIHEERGTRAADRYPLLDNRRSGPVILELANVISGPLRADRSGIDALIPADDPTMPGGDVRVALLDTLDDEIDFVADEVARFGEAAAQPSWGDVIVLARTADHLLALDRALRARGVPTQLIGTASLLQQPVVAEIRAYLEVLESPTANASLVRILTGPRWRIGPRDLAVLGAASAAQVGTRSFTRAGSVGEALADAVGESEVENQPSLIDELRAWASGELAVDGLSGQARERLADCARMLTDLSEHADEAPVDLIGRILHATGLGAHLLVGPDAEVAERARAVQEFTEIAAHFDDLDGGSTLTAFLARLDLAEDYNTGPTFEPLADVHAVRLMTVHKAKGLEAPHVFVTGLSEGMFPNSNPRPRWPTRPDVVPWRMRDDAPDHLASWPDLVAGPRTNDTKQFVADSRALEWEEERRLCYVAVTRAKFSVTLTGFGWGTAAKYRGPSEFLIEARQFALDGGGQVLTWADPPEDGQTNPRHSHEYRDWRWPIDAPADHLRAASDVRARVEQMRRAAPRSDESGDMRWSEEVAALIAEEVQRRRRRLPTLPDRVSVSDLVRWQADPDGMAQRWARPMPEPPSAAAYRGALLHAWIEQHYRSRRLLSIDDIPGAVDDGIDTQGWLAPLKERFLGTEWAARTPVAIEESFVVMHEGRQVRGRIDAVFGVDGRDVVVDWKTGAPGSADPGQLDLYRKAWAAITDQPLEAIDAQFVYL